MSIVVRDARRGARPVSECLTLPCLLCYTYYATQPTHLTAHMRTHESSSARAALLRPVGVRNESTAGRRYPYCGIQGNRFRASRSPFGFAR